MSSLLNEQINQNMFSLLFTWSLYSTINVIKMRMLTELLNESKCNVKCKINIKMLMLVK